MKINEITDKQIGQEVEIDAIVKSIKQTTGPTVFILKDETGEIKATGYLKPGERAFPSLNIGKTIHAAALVRVREAKTELELHKVSEKKTVSELTNGKFLIESANLESMRETFIQAVDIITHAAKEKRPIVIRHHDDTDGYVSGYVLERAILPLISSEKPYNYISRSSSRSPSYDYIDALRDLNNYLIDKERHNDKPPLIILADLGSNDQSIKAIKRLMIHGIDFLIIDHHKFDEENKKAVKVFLNTHAFGLTSDICAGALCCELAHLLNSSLDVKHLPALAMTADKSSGDDFEKYILLSGHDKTHFAKWALVTEHELYYLKFQESSFILDDLFMPNERNTKIIQLILPAVEQEFNEVNLAVKKYAKIVNFRHFKLIRINREMIASFGEFSSSKITRLSHDLVQGPRVTISELDDSLSYRVDNVKFSGVELIKQLKVKFPYAMISGGGHDDAGGIQFNPASKDDVIKFIMDYLKRIDK
jgi:RecJ-like exonuclease